MLELHAVVLSTVKRLLREMDLDERLRRQVRLARPLRAPGRRPPAAGTAPPGEPTPEAETQLLPRVPGEGRDRRRP